jgi:hypothetical protein
VDQEHAGRQVNIVIELLLVGAACVLAWAFWHTWTSDTEADDEKYKPLVRAPALMIGLKPVPTKSTGSEYVRATPVKAKAKRSHKKKAKP